MEDDEAIDCVPIERALNNARLIFGMPEKAMIFWAGLPVPPTAVLVKDIGPWVILIPIITIMTCKAINAIWPDFWQQAYLALTHFSDVRESPGAGDVYVFEP